MDKDINKILKMIPQGHVKKQDLSLQKVCTEWRWRLLTINKKNYIEISFKKCDSENRMFKTKSKGWCPKTIDASFDKYVIDEYFYYVENKQK